MIATFPLMHAGERLEEMLKERGIKVESLADKLGVSRQTVYNYIKRPRFDVDTYERLAAVLLKSYRIDPAQLAPTVGYTATDPDELRGLLKGIPDACLPNVKTMLQSELTTRVAVIAIIDTIMDRIGDKK